MYIARSKQFDKQYKKLPIKIKKQFAERLTLFLDNTTHSLLHTHTLSGKFNGFQSFNVNADFRAIFTIKDTDTIYFIAIGSHSQLYE